MCIGIYELLRNRKPRLILPHLKVGVRRLGGDGDSSSDLVGLRSLEFVSSRSFAAAQPPGKIDFPTRRSSCRSRLADTRKGSGKIQILVQGALHDSHEHRIVEACPPTVERRCRKFRLRRTGPDEIVKWSKIVGGLHIARTHGTTTCK